jgi:hypothetical protein
MTLFAGNMNAGTEDQQIVDTVSTIFAAARTDDVAKVDSVIASDFYHISSSEEKYTEENRICRLHRESKTK